MKKTIAPPSRAAIKQQVAAALCEDIGDGDKTAALIDATAAAGAKLWCRQPAVLCGSAWFAEAFCQLDAAVKVNWRYGDGDLLAEDAVVCEVSGNARAMLSAERTAINFLQTLSGTATVARRFADAVTGIKARIVDTRKTLPLMRVAQKYAVAVGGAHTHRVGLFDAILIKENHIAAAGSVAAAVQRARAGGVPVVVEVESLTELEQAIAAGATRVMLDNFDLPAMRDAVAVAAGRAELEASGGVTLATVRDIAATGIDSISVGALTKNLTAADFSLRFDVR